MFLKNLRNSSFLVLCLIVTACQTPTTYRDSHNLLWKLDGRIAARGETNIAAQIHWAHYDDGFEIHLQGPLGLGAVKAHGDYQHAEIQTHQGHFQGKLKPLLRQLLGVDIPVQHIELWLMGKAGGESRAHNYNEQGQLSSFETDQFKVRLDKYKSIEQGQASRSLPHRLIVNDKINPKRKVILAIHQWELHS